MRIDDIEISPEALVTSIKAEAGLKNIELMKHLSFNIVEKLSNGKPIKKQHFIIKKGLRTDSASVPYKAIMAALGVTTVSGVVGVSTESLDISAIYTLVPVIAMWLMVPLRKINMLTAGMIHDGLYAGKVLKKDYDEETEINFSRAECDRIFYLIASKYSFPNTPAKFKPLFARLAWLAVRIGGAGRYVGRAGLQF